MCLMLEALHLLAADAPVTVLAEGPALKLRQHGVADRFAPLPRLARVVCHGANVQWRTEALLACLSAGVPVLFLHHSGGISGVLLPTVGPSSRRDLAALLDSAAACPGFRSRLEDFCRAEQRRAVLASPLIAPGSPRTNPGIDLRLPRLVGAWIAKAKTPDLARALYRAVLGLAACALAEGLARTGVGPQFLARRTGGFALPENLAGVLACGLCPIACRASDHLPVDASPEAIRRAAIELFENARLTPARDQLLARLAYFLAAEP